METVARIFESCREDRLPASRAGRVAVAQEAGAACTEVSESRARRIPFSVEMFPPKVSSRWTRPARSWKACALHLPISSR